MSAHHGMCAFTMSIRRIYTPNTNQYATMGENASIPLTDEGNGGNIDTEVRQEIHGPKTGKIIGNVPERADGYTYYPKYRQDLEGNLFDYPTIQLPNRELTQTLTAIKAYYWDLYDGQPFSEYYLNP